MKSAFICAALLTIVNALPSGEVIPESESIYSIFNESSLNSKRDEPRDHNNKLCSDWKETDVRKVPRECIKPVFCETLSDRVHSEDCHFNGQISFVKDQIDNMSSDCAERAVCNYIRLNEEGSNVALDAKKQSAKPKHLVVPSVFVTDRSSTKDNTSCSDFKDEEDWSNIPDECVYNILCNNPKPDYEPDCTAIDPTQDEFSTEAVKRQTRECARELLCNRAIR